MQQKTCELQARAGRLSRAVAAVCAERRNDPEARKLSRRVVTASTKVDVGYRDASVSRSREEFIERISAVARHAKRVRALLLRMVETNHLTIAVARELILEARALEAIFSAARNTAKRRKAAGDKRSTA